MTHKHVEFFKRTFVEELCDALACCVFTAFVLFFDGFFTTAEAGLRAEVNEFFYFFKLAAHKCGCKTMTKVLPRFTRR